MDIGILLDKMWKEISNFQEIYGGCGEKIKMNNNTKEFLRKETDITISRYKPEIKTIFGMLIVIDDDLKDREFKIIVEEIEKDVHFGFVLTKELSYKFKIDFE